jgi:hypothetical protein
MKNVIVCKNCKSENPFYELICQSCKSYLRERVYNIDLWHTIYLLIESPSKAFRLIVNSEHKNFLTAIMLLVSGKVLLNGIFLKIFILKGEAEFPNYFLDFLLVIAFLVVIVLLFSAILKIITEKSGIITRYADNFSILTYSFIPYIFSFIILFPIELILFGGYLFSYAPSPFQIKETLSYVLLAFEGLIILWSIFLAISAIKVTTNNFLYSFIFGIVIHAVFYILLIFLSIVLFK